MDRNIAVDRLRETLEEVGRGLKAMGTVAERVQAIRENPERTEEDLFSALKDIEDVLFDTGLGLVKAAKGLAHARGWMEG